MYGFPYGWALCGVALLGAYSLLDISQVQMYVEVKMPQNSTISS